MEAGIEAGLECIDVADAGDGLLVEQGVTQSSIAATERALERGAPEILIERLGAEARDWFALVDRLDRPRSKSTEATRVDEAKLAIVFERDHEVRVIDSLLIGPRDAAAAGHAEVDEQHDLCVCLHV